MKHTRGFTVIEVVVVIAVLGIASVLFFMQKNTIETSSRDEERKIAINAMYYALEKVYYAENQSYPRELSAETLPSVDPNLFTDPNGVTLGQTTAEVDGEVVAVDSNYRYEPTNCTDDSCESYTLRADLENEDDFVRTSANGDTETDES